MKDPKLPTNAWNPDFAEPEDTPEDGAHTMSFQQDDWLRMKAQYEQRIGELEAYKSAFFRVGADIAKGECCDHLPDEIDNPNRCLREHLLVKFLAERRKLKALEDG